MANESNEQPLIAYQVGDNDIVAAYSREGVLRSYAK